jgi:hypothetical protein
MLQKVTAVETMMPAEYKHIVADALSNGFKVSVLQCLDGRLESFLFRNYIIFDGVETVLDCESNL